MKSKFLRLTCVGLTLSISYILYNNYNKYSTKSESTVYVGPTYNDLLKYNFPKEKDSTDSIVTELVATSAYEKELEKKMNDFKKNLQYELLSTQPISKQTEQSYIMDTHIQLINYIEDYLGIPYVWGGTNFSGFDCSGFVQSIYSKLGYTLPRTSSIQAKEGTTVSRDNLRLGDLLFFDTRNPRNLSDITTPTHEQENAELIKQGFISNQVSHVGIYIGDGIMLHASSGDGYITYSNLDTTYYKARFLFAKRII